MNKETAAAIRKWISLARKELAHDDSNFAYTTRTALNRFKAVIDLAAAGRLDELTSEKRP
jgi:hypothetical protein